MIIYRCDRCGKIVSESRISMLKTIIGEEARFLEDEEYDLCTECIESLQEWMEEPAKIKTKTINRLNAFQKAFEEMKGEE